MASRVDKIYGDAYISVKTDEDDLLEALEEAKAVKEILDSNTDFVNFLNQMCIRDSLLHFIKAIS